MVMRRLTILLVAIASTLLLASSAAYATSPPTWTPAVGAPPPWTAHVGELPAPPWLPALSIASATAAAGIVQGHVYDYDGDPVAGVEVGAGVVDDKGNVLWGGSATTDASGFYSVSGAPASTHGVLQGTTGTDEWLMWDLTFVDPGTSTYDVRLGRVAWSATRGGPQAASWQDPLYIWIAGTSATGSPFNVFTWMPTSTPGGSTDATVTGTASALPGDVRWMGFWFGANEAAEWDASDQGNAPVPVTAGGTTPLPFTFDESSAHRVLVTEPYWASGKPGTVLRLALQDFRAGMELTFEGSIDPDLHTTWNHKSYTTTGPEEQTVSLTVPKKAAPGRAFMVRVQEVTALPVGYLFFYVSFQVCTLKASDTSMHRGTAVKLSGVVPVAGNTEPGKGTPRYVWIFKRTSAAAQPTVWDATQQGWRLVERVRTDRYGRYHSALLTPPRTTWYVARYAGDADVSLEGYFRAYTSVRTVRVR
jgi:hypothetical protein